MPQMQPGQGRIVMPSRLAEERKPYVFQPYPSHRFHPDGRDVKVQDEDDELERCPASEGWVKTPFAPKPKPALAPEPEETGAKLKILLDHQRETFDRAYRQLSNEHERLKEYSTEQSAENLELRKLLKAAGEGNAALQEQLAQARLPRVLNAPVAEETAAPEETPAEAPGKKKK